MSRPVNKPPNQRARSRNSGEQNKAFHESVGTGKNLGALQDFVQTNNVSKRAKIIEKMIGFTLPHEGLTLGEMCIEMARDDRPQSGEWLDRAQGVLGKIASGYAFGSYRISQSKTFMR